MKLRKPIYAEAVIWIAENDASGDDQTVEDIALYISVILTADLFGVPSYIVARDVRDRRHGRSRVEMTRQLLAAENRLQ